MIQKDLDELRAIVSIETQCDSPLETLDKFIGDIPEEL